MMKPSISQKPQKQNKEQNQTQNQDNKNNKTSGEALTIENAKNLTSDPILPTTA